VSRAALVLAAALAAGAASAAPVAETDPRMPGFRRASACVAVMKRDVLALQAQYRGGALAVRPQIVRMTELGFTFIGVAYKQGLRKTQADLLLGEAEEAQQRAAPASLRQLSAECQTEAERLLKDSTVVERLLVAERAEARVERLLAARPAQR
jgi:hypothetical protein